MAKTLYILDGHGLIYAAFFAPMRQLLTSPSGEHTKATYIFTNALLGLMERQQPDLLAVAMDSKAPTFRRQLYPEYKAHRPPMPEDLPGQIARIEQILKALRIPVLRVDGFEADDVIGTVACRAAERGLDCSLCSGDKDILQLLGDHTRIYDVKTGAVTTAETLAQEMGITPQQFIDCLALQGDASDNVPGIPDVGPKTALDWIRRYGSIENLYQHADEITGKRGESLRASRAIADLSRRLVTIDCNVPLEIDWADLEVRPFDAERLARLFGELGFDRLLDRLCLPGPGKSADPPPARARPAVPARIRPGRRPARPCSLQAAGRASLPPWRPWTTAITLSTQSKSWRNSRIESRLCRSSLWIRRPRRSIP